MLRAVSRETLVPLALTLVAVAGVALGLALYSEHEEAVAAEAREARRAERESESERELEELRTESGELMPEVVDGVALGMTLEEVRGLRHTRMSRSSAAHDPGLSLFMERLPTGSEVMYLFDDATDRLVQVQVLSMMPRVEAIAPHLTAMNERYGTPTGVWDCPATGDVPTRRFTWRRAQTTVSDVFLIYEERVSVTLYVTTSERMEVSLRRSACRPVAAADIGTFPVADHVPTPD